MAEDRSLLNDLVVDGRTLATSDHQTFIFPSLMKPIDPSFAELIRPGARSCARAKYSQIEKLNFLFNFEMTDMSEPHQQMFEMILTQFDKWKEFNRETMLEQNIIKILFKSFQQLKNDAIWAFAQHPPLVPDYQSNHASGRKTRGYRSKHISGRPRRVYKPKRLSGRPRRVHRLSGRSVVRSEAFESH